MCVYGKDGYCIVNVMARYSVLYARPRRGSTNLSSWAFSIYTVYMCLLLYYFLLQTVSTYTTCMGEGSGYSALTPMFTNTTELGIDYRVPPQVECI